MRYDLLFLFSFFEIQSQFVFLLSFFFRSSTMEDETVAAGGSQSSALPLL